MTNEQTPTPMTAEEFYKSDKCTLGFPSFMPFLFAAAYADYRLQFEQEERQQSWMPTEEEWKQFPDAKWAAMDPDGAVFQYKYKPSPRYKRWSVAVGAYAPYAMRVPVQAWTEAVVQRPEMW